MSKDTVISVERLGKRYRLGEGLSNHGSVRGVFAARAAALLRGRLSGSPVQGAFWALQDASFDIARGENVGIIGLNGAGKSTLLKILSRITTPTIGVARVTGRLGALLEVGTGFHRELTGRENTFLYGAILGMSRAEIARKFDAIVDFSEIQDFIDTPVKHYSSGMYVRLAFAVAAHLDPNILLLDEVLAVGDFSFQRKCMELARQLQRKGSTILFVSHNMFSIRTMCQRVIYMKQGRIAYDGPTDEGLRRYDADNKPAPKTLGDALQEPAIAITAVNLCGEHGGKKTIFDYGERMRIRITYDALRPVDRPHFVGAFRRADETLCCSFSSYCDDADLPRVFGSGIIEVLIPPLKLVSERYTVQVDVRENGSPKSVVRPVEASFHLRHGVFEPSVYGVFHEPGQWNVVDAVHVPARVA